MIFDVDMARMRRGFADADADFTARAGAGFGDDAVAAGIGRDIKLQCLRLAATRRGQPDPPAVVIRIDQFASGKAAGVQGRQMFPIEHIFADTSDTGGDIADVNPGERQPAHLRPRCLPVLGSNSPASWSISVPPNCSASMIVTALA